LRRQEFGDKIQKDQKTLQELRQKKQDNSVWRYDFLTNSKYNKRIYNIKTNRIKKINKILQKNITFRNF
jgi:N-glycosylase/DNA lyase